MRLVAYRLASYPGTGCSLRVVYERVTTSKSKTVVGAVMEEKVSRNLLEESKSSEEQRKVEIGSGGGVRSVATLGAIASETSS